MIETTKPRPTTAVRNARRFIISSAGECIADDSVKTLLPIIAVAVAGASAFEVGLINALSLSAFIFLAVPAGVWVDRARKRRVLIGTNIVRVAGVGLLIATYIAGHLSLSAVLAAAAIFGICDVFFTTAHTAALGNVIHGDELSITYSRIQTVKSSSAVASPGIAGSLVKIAGSPFALGIAVVGYAYSSIVLAGLPQISSTSEAETDRKFFSDARAGIRHLLTNRLIFALCLSVVAINAASMVGETVEVYYAINGLNVAPAVYAALGIAGAAGGLAGASLASTITRRIGIGRTKTFAAIATVPAIAALPLAKSLPGNVAIWVAVTNCGWDFLVIVIGISGAGIVPRLAPKALLGRVIATYRLFTLGVMPLAALAAGGLASLVGPTPVLWLWGAIAVCSAVPIITSPIRKWKTFPPEFDAEQHT